jgi:hypothetical protein
MLTSNWIGAHDSQSTCSCSVGCLSSCLTVVSEMIKDFHHSMNSWQGETFLASYATCVAAVLECLLCLIALILCELMAVLMPNKACKHKLQCFTILLVQALNRTFNEVEKRDTEAKTQISPSSFGTMKKASNVPHLHTKRLLLNRLERKQDIYFNKSYIQNHTHS